jgi:sugar lactone lactonase YvrE
LTTAACFTQQAQSPPPKPAPPPLEFLGAWGTRGDGPGLLNHPVAIATDFAGNVYLADEGKPFIHKFSPEGHPLLSFEDFGLKGVQSLAVDRGGAIYAGITGSPFGIIVFFPDGSRLRRIGQLHAPPEAIAVDDEGNIFALSLSSTLEKFNPRGRSVRFLRKRGDADGEFAYPTAIAVGSDGLLYVADMGNGRIQSLSQNGDFISSWNVAETGQQDIPAIMSLATLKGNIFILLLDHTQYRLQARAPEGKLLVQEALAGQVPPNQKEAWAISASPRNELFLLDRAGARVLRFRINF